MPRERTKTVPSVDLMAFLYLPPLQTGQSLLRRRSSPHSLTGCASLHHPNYLLNFLINVANSKPLLGCQSTAWFPPSSVSLFSPFFPRLRRRTIFLATSSGARFQPLQHRAVFKTVAILYFETRWRCQVSLEQPRIIYLFLNQTKLLLNSIVCGLNF